MTDNYVAPTQEEFVTRQLVKKLAEFPVLGVNEYVKVMKEARIEYQARNILVAHLDKVLEGYDNEMRLYADNGPARA